jgi:hypothetical protein
VRELQLVMLRMRYFLTALLASLGCYINLAYQHFRGDFPRPHCLEWIRHTHTHARTFISALRIAQLSLADTSPSPSASALSVLLRSQVLSGLKVAAAADPAVRFPKLLYTVPIGQNPTGCTITAERRTAVYRLCQQYNLLLIEDDPYFFLQYAGGPGTAC